MTYIFIEIGGFKIKKKNNKKVALDITNHLKGILSKDGNAELLIQSEDCFLFSFEVETNLSTRLSNSVSLTMDYLEKIKKTVHSSIIYIDEYESQNIDKIFNELQLKVFKIPEIFGIFIDLNITTKLNELFSLKRKDNYYKVEKNGSCWNKKYSIEKIHQNTFKLLENELSIKNRDYDFLVLQGAYQFQIRGFLIQALKHLNLLDRTLYFNIKDQISFINNYNFKKTSSSFLVFENYEFLKINEKQILKDKLSKLIEKKDILPIIFVKDKESIFLSEKSYRKLVFKSINLSRLDIEILKILYISIYGCSFISKIQLENFLLKSNLFENELSVSYLKFFSKWGYLTWRKSDNEIIKYFKNDIEKHIGKSQIDILSSELSLYLFKEFKKKTITNIKGLLIYISEKYENEEKFYMIFYILKSIILSYNIKEYNEIISNIKFPNKDEEKYSIIKDCANLYLSFFTGDKELAEISFSKIVNNKVKLTNSMNLQKDLAIVEYKFSKLQYKEANKEAKELLFKVNNSNDNFIKNEINLNLSNTLFSLKKYSESIAYLNFAKENKYNLTEQTLLDNIKISNLIYYYINYQFEKLLNEISYIKEKGIFLNPYFKVFLNFIEGRTYFSLGEYFKAEKSFKYCVEFESNILTENDYLTFNNWLSRTFAYQGFKAKAIKRLSINKKNAESLLFLAETLYLNSDYEEAYKIITDAKKINQKNKIYFKSNKEFKFKSGFYLLEDRIFIKNNLSILEDYINIIKILLEFLLKYENSADNLFNTIRDVSLSFKENNNEFIFYSIGILSKHFNKNTKFNISNIINKSNRFLQNLTSDYKDNNIRKKILNKNYWNNYITILAEKLMI